MNIEISQDTAEQITVEVLKGVIKDYPDVAQEAERVLWLLMRPSAWERYKNGEGA